MSEKKLLALGDFKGQVAIIDLENSVCYIVLIFCNVLETILGRIAQCVASSELHRHMCRTV